MDKSQCLVKSQQAPWHSVARVWGLSCVSIISFRSRVAPCRGESGSIFLALRVEMNLLVPSHSPPKRTSYDSKRRGERQAGGNHQCLSCQPQGLIQVFIQIQWQRGKADDHGG